MLSPSSEQAINGPVRELPHPQHLQWIRPRGGQRLLPWRCIAKSLSPPVVKELRSPQAPEGNDFIAIVLMIYRNNTKQLINGNNILYIIIAIVIILIKWSPAPERLRVRPTKLHTGNKETSSPPGLDSSSERSP